MLQVAEHLTQAPTTFAVRIWPVIDVAARIRQAAEAENSRPGWGGRIGSSRCWVTRIESLEISINNPRRSRG